MTLNALAMPVKDTWSSTHWFPVHADIVASSCRVLNLEDVYSMLTYFGSHWQLDGRYQQISAHLLRHCNTWTVKLCLASIAADTVLINVAVVQTDCAWSEHSGFLCTSHSGRSLTDAGFHFGTCASRHDWNHTFTVHIYCSRPIICRHIHLRGWSGWSKLSRKISQPPFCAKDVNIYTTFCHNLLSCFLL